MKPSLTSFMVAPPKLHVLLIVAGRFDGCNRFCRVTVSQDTQHVLVKHRRPHLGREKSGRLHPPNQARDFLTILHSSPITPSLDLEKERLQGEQAALFRSALGLILYIAQDRPDIQFPTKILATYMAHPCIKALAAVKHFALYLLGTETSGILLRRCEFYDTVFDKWNESEVVEPVFRQDRSLITMDILSDSSWGDERSTRKSTTSGMIFMNGYLIHSICRAQATIALSSCEAELYAANSTMIESIYLNQLIQFLMNNEAAVRQRLFVDGSSANFVVRRSGVGRLKRVSIKHMFLQQLLRQKAFSIHKVPTRINPADLNTKKLSFERRNLPAILAGLFHQASSIQEDAETLNTRRAQRQQS